MYISGLNVVCIYLSWSMNYDKSLDKTVACKKSFFANCITHFQNIKIWEIIEILFQNCFQHVLTMLWLPEPAKEPSLKQPFNENILFTIKYKSFKVPPSSTFLNAFSDTIIFISTILYFICIGSWDRWRLIEEIPALDWSESFFGYCKNQATRLCV